MSRRFECGAHLHAKRHVDLGSQLHLVGGQVVDRTTLLREIVTYELLVHILEQWADAGVCAHYFEAVGRLHEGLRELHAEPSNDDRHKPLQRHVCESTLKVHSARSNQRQSLLERHSGWRCGTVGESNADATSR